MAVSGGTAVVGAYKKDNGSNNTGAAYVFQSETPCPDFDDDGVVTVSDLIEVARRVGSETGDRRYDSTFDLNQDGRIDVADVAIVLEQFGESCP